MNPADRERGAAVSDFALISGLVALLFLAVVQLGLVLHVRNTIVASAAEGARVAARQGATPRDGVTRTRELITSALSSGFARDITIGEGEVDGVRVVTVVVTSPIPLFGPLGAGEMTLTGRAFDEDQ